MPRGRMKDFGKKNMGGKVNRPVQLKTPKELMRHLKSRKPTQY